VERRKAWVSRKQKGSDEHLRSLRKTLKQHRRNAEVSEMDQSWWNKIPRGG
jgi:hypothetical protein